MSAIFKGDIRVSVLKPFPHLRQGGEIFADSRRVSLDQWKDRQYIVYSTGKKVLKDEFYKDTIAMNLQYQKFGAVMLHMTCSTLFRDFLFSFNDTGQWGISSRAIESYDRYRQYGSTVSEEFWNEDGSLHPDIVKKVELFNQKIEENKDSAFTPNDACSKYIYYGCSTEVWWSITPYDLIKILKMMEERFPLFFEFYGVKIIEGVDRALKSLKRPTYYLSAIYNEVKDRIYYADLLNRYLLPENVTGVEEDQYARAVMRNVGVGLYSHLCRHSYVTLKGFLDLFIDKDANYMRSIPFGSETVIPKLMIYHDDPVRMDRITSTRLCWFAKTDIDSLDSWSHYLDPIIQKKFQNDAKTVMENLPCCGDHTKCSIAKDMELRIIGKEPDFPCAILCQSRDLAESKLARFDSLINRMYLEMFDLGLVKDNPDNENRKTYEAAISKSAT